MAAQVPPADRTGLIPADALRAVPGCEAGQAPLAISVLPGGGRVNHSLRIDTADGRFVLRLPVSLERQPGVDRERELIFQRAAAAASLAPRVLRAGEGARWLLMDFVEGRMWRRDELADRRNLVRLGERLALLHDLAPPAVAALDVADIVQGQVQKILARDPSVDVEMDALTRKALQAGAQCAASARRLVINHGDLNVANILGEGPKLVDWEYAQLASPLYDLACVLDYYPEVAANLDSLLAAAGCGDRASRAELAAHRRLFELLNSLWGRAQGP